MIVQWFLEGLVTLAQGFIALIPSFARPAWLDGALVTWAQVVGYMAQLNNWVPLGAIGLAAIFITSAWLASIVIRIARIAYSMFTFGGGAT